MNMKRLINWLKFDCVWSAVIVSLIAAGVTFYILYAGFNWLIMPTEKDFLEMESQIIKIQESPKILFELDTTITIKDGQMEVLLTDKNLAVQFDKDFNVISKSNPKEAVELECLIVIAIISLIIFVVVYKVCTQYYAFDDYYILERIERKIKRKKKSEEKTRM